MPSEISCCAQSLRQPGNERSRFEDYPDILLAYCHTHPHANYPCDAQPNKWAPVETMRHQLWPFSYGLSTPS